MANLGRFNSERVAELRTALQAHCGRGDIPGLVALAARGGEVQVEVIGTQRFGGSVPMTRDTIFRIASLTKPITAAAVMMLVDDGTLRLEDSVERWLPELANRRVLRSLDAALDDTVPARRAITVQDVLTYTFGLGSVMAPFGTYPIQTAIREGRLGGDGPEYLLNPPATDDWIRRIGELPLMHQPGERWLYNTSGDVLGVLVARASGKSFGAFLDERLFGPLGMRDTAFHVPGAKRERLPDCYAFDRDERTFVVFDSARDSAWSRTPVFESGAGGLVSTVDDYHAFCRMMLNRGRHEERRLLSEASIRAMTRDQLTAAQREGTELFLGSHSSWGFGVAVDTARAEPWNVPGRFGWVGGLGTSAYADPANDFIGAVFTQRVTDSPEAAAVFTDFWKYAYRMLEA